MPVRDMVVEMLKARQLEPDEAIEVLDPLYQVHQAAVGTTTGGMVQSQPLSARKARRTKQLETTLNDLEKKYQWKKLWHRLTRKKRLAAVETARALVAVCEGCPHARWQMPRCWISLSAS